MNCWDWIDQLLDLAGLKPLEKSISFPAAYRIGALMEGVYQALRLRGEPRMTRFLAAQLAKNHYFDISQAKQDFGFSPHVSTATGMKELAEHLAPR